MQNLSKVQLDKLKREISETLLDLDLETKRSRLGELQNMTLVENFWGEPDSAKKIMQELEHIKKELDTSDYLSTKIDTLIELFEASTEEERNMLKDEFTQLQNEVDSFQIIKFLSGKYDTADAILSIHAGQGGTEANDWTEMLLRMYKRYAEKMNWSVTTQHMVQGTEAGISSVTIIISGQYAFGMLNKESGVHRLVRQSPFNAQSLRQTSFSGVEVTPVIDEDDEEIVIPDTDIEFKAVRSSGAGGQSVNKTSSAVQIKHIPSGIVVHNSEQRKQAQNRAAAMKILKAKLWQIQQDKQAKELSDIKGDYKVAGWGNQIRNYVLHPYKLVKDLRTGIESSHPEKVLDGDLNPFIEAEIRIG
jgi:peptide chain release factor 2